MMVAVFFFILNSSSWHHYSIRQKLFKKIFLRQDVTTAHTEDLDANSIRINQADYIQCYFSDGLNTVRKEWVNKSRRKKK